MYLMLSPNLPLNIFRCFSTNSTNPILEYVLIRTLLIKIVNVLNICNVAHRTV